jgi:hypothetical protein
VCSTKHTFTEWNNFFFHGGQVEWKRSEKKKEEEEKNKFDRNGKEILGKKAHNWIRRNKCISNWGK